jgi:WD40 repeat protein
MLKKIFFTALLFTVVPALAQKEAANWYFGEKAGLDFNSGVPVTLTNGQLLTDEGCSAISDADGVLLFYTGGQVIYNANHQEMLNGTGLLGDESSTQSAIILPSPGDPTKYYVFAVDNFGGANGLSYSVIDMTLDGGLGGVVPAQKNIRLATPVSEKLTAVYHPNQNDLWVICHRLNGNEFLAYKVTSAGVNTTPVVSAIGTASTGGFGSHGYIKVSPNGKLLASAKMEFFRGIELFDFDATLGTITNPRQINTVSSYGVEFSPNSKILYSTSVLGSIRQYNLSVPDLAHIQASEAIIAPGETYWALQVAIDGKIYAASPYLGTLSVINNS